MTLEQRFGGRLRQVRRHRGLSAAALAERAGLTTRAVNYLERGERMARLDTLLALAAALEVEVGLLLRGLRI
jgi:transcriptional regulator with XRE-family HTH domain